MAKKSKDNRLKKELGLFDVYVISTGAMISSGFFLLPGLAAAKSGPSVVLAYGIAGILILPAMFSKAELSTAMPKAGGTYYFLDRSLGPMFGTIGGLGTYLALVLKTAFALIGIGAYLTIYLDLPIKPVAIALTVAFMGFNIFGAKETTGLQRVLVSILVAVLVYFIVQGVGALFSADVQAGMQEKFTPFMPYGVEGLLATIGFVFVSYAGLTKVASVAEEVKNPDRNLPLGMILSLASTTVIYVIGIFIIVAVMDSADLHSDLTPVASASRVFMTWPSSGIGVLLVVIAATAAFASTGNAGILAASRYPFAMARDRLVPSGLAKLGRFQTPVPAILLTSVLIILFIIFLDEEGIAKLASAFQLFIFVLVNFAVIVMRESRITAYDPGFESPWYPWMQIFGMIASLALIIAMGWLASLFTLGIVVLCLVWFHYYARKRVVRDGAIYHWFAHLGRRIYRDLDVELRSIIKEKGLREKDPFEQIVANAPVIDCQHEIKSFNEVVDLVSSKVVAMMPDRQDELMERFAEVKEIGSLPIAKGVSLPHMHLAGIEHPIMVVVRSMDGINTGHENADAHLIEEGPVYALFMLISEEENARQHLRLLAQIAVCVDAEDFIENWRSVKNEQALKEILLRDERFLSLRLTAGMPAEKLIGKALKEVYLPESALVVLVRRDGQTHIPHGSTILEENDRLTIIGDPKDIRMLFREYIANASTPGVST
ncbi:MAG: amino acid permease [Rhodothermaceae bacterium]|nr:amino acid permease [Rhodothermaceae bacterium]